MLRHPRRIFHRLAPFHLANSQNLRTRVRPCPVVFTIAWGKSLQEPWIKPACSNSSEEQGEPRTAWKLSSPQSSAPPWSQQLKEVLSSGSAFAWAGCLLSSKSCRQECRKPARAVSKQQRGLPGLAPWQMSVPPSPLRAQMWKAAGSGWKPYPQRPVVDTIVLSFQALSSGLISGVSLGWAEFSTPALGEV